MSLRPSPSKSPRKVWLVSPEATPPRLLVAALKPKAVPDAPSDRTNCQAAAVPVADVGLLVAVEVGQQARRAAGDRRGQVVAVLGEAEFGAVSVGVPDAPGGGWCLDRLCIRFLRGDLAVVGYAFCSVVQSDRVRDGHVCFHCLGGLYVRRLRRFLRRRCNSAAPAGDIGLAVAVKVADHRVGRCPVADVVVNDAEGQRGRRQAFVEVRSTGRGARRARR